MKTTRSLFFGAAFLAVATGVLVMRFQGGAVNGGEAWLVPVGVVGGLYAVAVVIDVLLHAWRGRGQACRTCGHVRPMRSFRMEGPCPQCGE